MKSNRMRGNNLTMKKIKVGVIFGGQSTEHDVSIISGSSVIKNLSKDKYEIYPIYISRSGEWFNYIKPVKEVDIFNIGEEPEELEKITNNIEVLKQLDIVFPVLHGLFGEDGTIQGMLEMTQVPYVGCKVLASSICMDKSYSKIIFEKAGIKQSKYISLKAKNKYIYIDERLNQMEMTLEDICDIVKQKLKFPVFVKPSNSGSSVGVNKASNKEELKKCIEIAKKYDNEILVEQCIYGKEVECAVLGTDEIKASCVGQILSAEEFYDYESKYKNANSKTIIPANISEEIAEKIRKIAIKAFKAVNGSGLSRVDFFVEDDTNEIYINEINTIPGFTNISMYPQLWEQCGLKYEKLLDCLIENELK